MRDHHLRWVTVIAAAVGVLAFGPAYGTTESQKAAVTQAIEKVPVTELAAASVRLVQQANAKERADMALATVEVILAKKPVVATALVAALAKAAPDLAAPVAARAAQLLPQQAVAIARAAALAAPKYAAQIAVGVGKAAPGDAVRVAEAVIFVAPTAERAVTAAMVAELPPQSVAGLQAASPASEEASPYLLLQGNRPISGKFSSFKSAEAFYKSLPANVRDTITIVQTKQTTRKGGRP